jgi:3-isopropylmalate/(R)-2-methylmalate dehydratase large subunit
MRVNFTGSPRPGVYAKDMIMALIGKVGAKGGISYAVEFAGEAVRSLPVEGRLTLCNMSIEFSAKYGFVPPDDLTIAYLKGREFSPKGAHWDQAEEHWRSLATDKGAVFDREVTIDCNALEPQVTWGINPEQVAAIGANVPEPSTAVDGEARQLGEKALAYMRLDAGAALEGMKIDAAYIGSCTNARLSDLRAAADILKGKKIAAGIQAICVPGSTPVKRAAETEGLDRIFIDAGFEWHESACGMCSNIGGDRFNDKRVISTTNRNFEGRQGVATRTHLASPATVAASALAGRITDPRKVS